MTELDIERRLQNLRESLGRIKALLAWERLKRSEADSGQPWVFQIHDSTAEELKNEYAFFVAALLNLYSVLNDRSFPIPKAVRRDVERQLADLEWQVDVLQLDRRF